METPATPLPPPWNLLRRHPLFDARGGIGAWSLELAPVASARCGRPDAPASVLAAHGQALAAGAAAIEAEGRSALVLAPGSVLAAQALPELPSRSWLGLSFEAVGELRRLGTPDEVLTRVSAQRVAPPGLLKAERSLFEARGRLSVPIQDSLSRWVVLGLGSIEAIHESIRRGAFWSGGQAELHQAPPSTARLDAHAASTARLLGALMSGASPRELAETAHLDATLTWRLLQVARSARFGRSATVATAQDAILRLGSVELSRWLTALLISARPQSPLARGLQEQALARGRLLESLAARVGREPPEALFLVGSFSLLEALLQVPLEVALASIKLPEAALDALIAHEGPWAPYFEIALGLEGADENRLETACAALGLSIESVASLAAESASWAAQAINALPGAGSRVGVASAP